MNYEWENGRGGGGANGEHVWGGDRRGGGEYSLHSREHNETFTQPQVSWRCGVCVHVRVCARVGVGVTLCMCVRACVRACV